MSPRKHTPAPQPRLEARTPVADDEMLPVPERPKIGDNPGQLSTPEYWTVIIYDDGAPYVRKCVTAQASNAMGEAIHHYSMDRNLNVNRIAGALVIPAGTPIVLGPRPWEYDGEGSASVDDLPEIPPRHQDVTASSGAEPGDGGATESKDVAPPIDPDDLPWE